MKRCLHCMEEYEEGLRTCPVCGWDGSSTSDGSLEPGEILQGRYIVGTGRGEALGQARYIGWDALFSRKVMVTECRRQDGISAALEYGGRLILLDGARGVLDVYAVFEKRGAVYMIQEYPGERTLSAVLRERGRLAPREVRYLVETLAKGLMAAHRRGICHGAVSPDSCYQVETGAYKILFPLYDGGTEAMETRMQADIRGLAELAGAALLGAGDWERNAVEKRLKLLKARAPEHMWTAIAKAAPGDGGCGFSSVCQFLDQFLDETTMELSDEDGGIEPDMGRKPAALWKRLFQGL